MKNSQDIVIMMIYLISLWWIVISLQICFMRRYFKDLGHVSIQKDSIIWSHSNCLNAWTFEQRVNCHVSQIQNSTMDRIYPADVERSSSSHTIQCQTQCFKIITFMCVKCNELESIGTDRMGFATNQHGIAGLFIKISQNYHFPLQAAICFWEHCGPLPFLGAIASFNYLLFGMSLNNSVAPLDFLSSNSCKIVYHILCLPMAEDATSLPFI